MSLKSPWVEMPLIWHKVLIIWQNYNRNLKQLEESLEKEIFKLRIGDELQQGVMKLAKVYIAQKRKISIGDKMSGRHGNKGIVSIIVPEEDMPFTKDGKTVDIILNPLGVPSRMNLGQLYETLLGWAGAKLNRRYKTPVFNGANLEDVQSELKEANLPESGKIDLYDGTQNSYIISWDSEGKQISSLDFANLIKQKIKSQKSISFLVGGSHGFNNEVKHKSDMVLSASLLTFPHKLFRLILVEQIYRAHTILANMPYHK